MNWWRRFRRRRDDAEVDRELRYHVDRRIEDQIDAGWSPDEARRRVRLEFGDLELTRDECRDVRPLAWLDDFARDVRIGWRALGRDRLFAVAVIAMLALGIGAGVAMYSVLDAVVLRPLPYAASHELAIVSTHLIARNQWDGTSVPNFDDWRQQSRTFAAMTCHRRTSVGATTYAVEGTPRRTQESVVCAEFFDVLGTAPMLGRPFTRGEFERGERVVLISEGLWQEQFGRSPAVLERAIAINGQPHRIIGVMPHRFQMPAADVQLWRPISATGSWQGLQQARDGDAIEVLGRLAPGVTVADAQVELRAIAERLRMAYPENRDIDVRVSSLFDRVVGARTARGVWIGFAAVLSLLAVACANAGGLLTARAARRRREFALRVALGAGRLRIVRQLLAESVSLLVVASAAGLALAVVLVRLLLAAGPHALPRLEDAAIDVTAVGVALAGGLAIAIGCGVLPAILAARGPQRAALTVRDRTGLAATRWQDALVAAQIAGAVVLLVGAALLAQSFLRAYREDPGYAADELVIARIDLPLSSYEALVARADYFDRTHARLSRLPGVTAVGAIGDFFMRRNGDQRVTAEGRSLAGPGGDVPRLSIESVTPGFFGVIGVRIVEGRDFEPRDVGPGAPGVFIVNQSLARRLWPGERAVGKRLVSGSTPRADGRWDTVIGVVQDVRREALDLPPILNAFVPTYLRTMDLTVRTSVNPEDLAAAVQMEIRAIDATVPVPQILTARSRLDDRLGSRRFESVTLGIFAGSALAISAAGLYALLAYQVAMRRREIGIRSALGGGRSTIVAMILARGLRLAAIGSAVGLVGAVAGARFIQSLLYETGATRPGVYVAAVALVLTLATLASLVPAFRAAAIDPVRALREEA